MQKEVKWFHVVGVLLALLIAGMFSRGSISGNAGYYDAGPGYYGRGFGPGGFGFGGGFFGFGTFSEIYAQYGYIIDAILFLTIFLGLGKSIFGSHFEKGGKPIYTGVGIFLALALLLWEERTGYYLLVEFGSLVLILFLAVIVFFVFKWMKQSGAGGFAAFSLAYLMFYFFIYNGCASPSGGYLAVGSICDFIYQFNLDLILSIVMWVAIIGLVVSIITGIKRKREKHGR